MRYFYLDGEKRNRNQPFGYLQLPESGDIAIWTGGEKDVMALRAAGYWAITSTSETGSLPLEVLEDLKTRGFEVIILFDNDKTGLIKSEEFSKKFGFKRIVLPVMKGGKDISDYFKLGNSVEDFQKLLEEARAKSVGSNLNSDAVSIVDNQLKAIDEKPIVFKSSIESKFDHALRIIQSKNSIRRNEITSQLEINGRELSEAQSRSIFIEVHRNLPNFSYHDFEILIASDEIPSYNPLKEFVKYHSTTIRQGNLEALARCLISTQGQEYVLMFLKRWLIGIVASIFDKNYNSLLLVIIGPINIGKTFFFRNLLPPQLSQYYAESKFDEGKDSRILTTVKLLVLFDELDRLNKSEAKAFRNFISANEHTDRAPYARKSETRKRYATLAGTSNDRDIIQDPENNRRIIPIEITDIDRDLFNSIDKVSLLIEAYQLYMAGERWELNRDEIRILHEKSDEYHVSSMEVELIQKFFRLPNPEEEQLIEQLTATEIITVLEKEIRQKLNLNNIGKALRILGFDKKVVKIPLSRKNKQVYLVVRVIPEEGIDGSYGFKDFNG